MQTAQSENDGREKKRRPLLKVMSALIVCFVLVSVFLHYSDSHRLQRCASNLCAIQTGLHGYYVRSESLSPAARRKLLNEDIDGLALAFGRYYAGIDDVNIALWSADKWPDALRHLPPSEKWCDLMGGCGCQFRCPGMKKEKGRGLTPYVLNQYAVGLDRDMPGNMVLVFEGPPGWNQVGGPELLSADNHRGKGANILFADGHVEFVKKKDFAKLRWQAEDNRKQK